MFLPWPWSNHQKTVCGALEALHAWRRVLSLPAASFYRTVKPNFTPFQWNPNHKFVFMFDRHIAEYSVSLCWVRRSVKHLLTFVPHRFNTQKAHNYTVAKTLAWKRGLLNLKALLKHENLVWAAFHFRKMVAIIKGIHKTRNISFGLVAQASVYQCAWNPWLI